MSIPPFTPQQPPVQPPAWRTMLTTLSQRAQAFGQRTRFGVGQWWQRGPWHKVLLIAIVPFLCICACCSTSLAFSATPYGQQLARESEATDTAVAIATQHAQATAAEYALLHPKPTATEAATPGPTSTPLPTATSVPTATPIPTNTTVPPTPTRVPPPPPPTATPVPQDCQAICNPWGYDFNPGNLIYSPPSDFCNVFPCIPSFWNQTNGYVVECQDGDYSHSGGRSGVCSYHGGYKQTLYSH